MQIIFRHEQNPDKRLLYNSIKRKNQIRRGGQLGHQSSFRPFVDKSQVTKIVKCMPQSICECGGEIRLRKRKKPVRHQIFELPEIKPIITELVNLGEFAPVANRALKCRCQKEWGQIFWVQERWHLWRKARRYII